MDRKPVTSSNIESVGWENDCLEVKFKGSPNCHRFYGVSKEGYEALLAASSVGTHFHANVRTNLKFRHKVKMPKAPAHG